MPKATVIAAFYNKLDFLKLVLAGFNRQTEKDFELIIADDGSSPEAVKKIELLSNSYSFPIIHIRQEDKGFRKNKILNKAIVASNSGYLIFIDADCIPHPNFVEQHLKYSQSGVSLTGRRVNLSSKISNGLTEELISTGYLDRNRLAIVMDGIFGKSNYVEKGFYFNNELLRKVFNSKNRGLLGSNFSIHKNDIIAINGFDERFEAPSIGEDSEIQFRLELNGVRIVSVNHIAIQYHLFHKLQERKRENIILFEEIKKTGLSFTPFGIEQNR